MDTYLELMEKSVFHLGDYVQDIIEVSKRASDELQASAIDFRDLIDEIILGIKHIDEFEKVRLDVSIDQKIDFVSDKHVLETIFSNLITNAIIYHDSEKQQPEVTIEIKVIGPEAHCSVIDNGLGIDKAHLEKIFQKFYRANSNKQGSGLGLYLVHESVQKLNGKIEVESESNKGTAFHIVLPAK
jgi:signal transduction histidine kinase